MPAGKYSISTLDGSYYYPLLPLCPPHSPLCLSFPLYPAFTGLIRRFKHVMEDRINHPEVYQANKDQYFQRAWSGEQFRNLKWADQHGDGRNYTWGR
jgi:hypothetical protein